MPSFLDHLAAAKRAAGIPDTTSTTTAPLDTGTLIDANGVTVSYDAIGELLRSGMPPKQLPTKYHPGPDEQCPDHPATPRFVISQVCCACAAERPAFKPGEITGRASTHAYADEMGFPTITYIRDWVDDPPAPAFPFGPSW